MYILLVLGEPKRLEARTGITFIGWLGLLNQPLPQLFFNFALNLFCVGGFLIPLLLGYSEIILTKA
jgi:hypothetical protein